MFKKTLSPEKNFEKNLDVRSSLFHWADQKN